MRPFAAAGTAARTPRRRRPRTVATGGSLLALLRPGQWPKNVLVLAAPAAAGTLLVPATLARSTGAVVAFVCVSVAVYAVNDVHDADLDRLHPAKAARPVASGAVPPQLALAVAAGAAALGVALGVLLGGWTALVLVSYLASSLAYTLRLKHVPVLDVVVVAAGFVLRALAGAAANGLPVSNWFLLVSLFGALYLVTGKRTAELAGAPAGAGGEITTRPVLAAYPASWLAQVATLSLSGTVLCYAMWAFQYLGTDVIHPVLAATVLPFLVAVLRYGLLVSQGHGERPEHLVLRDRPLLAAGMLWAAMMAVSLYLV